MSESMGAGEQRERTDEDGPGTTRTKPAGGRRPRGRRARWAVAGAAAVVVIGGGAAAATIHHHHHEDKGRGDHKMAFAGGHKWRDGSQEKSKRRDGHDGRTRAGGPGPRGQHGRDFLAGHAPAPLPSLSAADAVGKAAAAVKDGKVESLAPVTEQGGGRAWKIVVVGPDAVRHVVTVDGTSGNLTGNTVLGG
ncbi:hypothetical protein [Streptomyces sp. C36]|uniref:hypothetical protein n=1 Tax=Streptomyces sp. C36 TaxID=3237122 RepID=UPI0034C68ED2